MKMDAKDVSQMDFQFQIQMIAKSVNNDLFTI